MKSFLSGGKCRHYVFIIIIIIIQATNNQVYLLNKITLSRQMKTMMSLKCVFHLTYDGWLQINVNNK